ncbi:MAG: transcriptional regulator [Alphaproteobacteria bacterium]|nr:MAG: transcriptional regulator [Alphaproteobacteria bacterium]
MDPQSQLADRIVAEFDRLPAQLGVAARYMLDHSDDVALLSMREQARRAGVQPWTMTRLAKRLGYAGYEEIRAVAADQLRRSSLGFAGKANIQVARQRETGAAALVAEMAHSLAAGVARLAESEQAAALIAVSEAVAKARRIYCLGLRSSNAVAAQLAYMLEFLGEQVVLVDRASASDLDALRHAERRDVLLAVSVAPYTRATVEAARLARQRGVPVLAITDSRVSPIARLADHAVQVTTDSPSFFHTMAPAFAVGEILVTLIAGRRGKAALAGIARTESQLAAMGIHYQPPPARAP